MTIDLNEPDDRDRLVTFSLDKFTTTARFDAKGHLHFQAPMFTEKSTLTWILPDHTTCRRSVTFSKYQETFVAAVL